VRTTGWSTGGFVPCERALVRVPAVRLAVLIEVGEPVELGVAVRVVLVHHVDLHLAESARKGDLALRRHVLRREQQDLVAQEGLVYGAKNSVIHFGREVDAGDLRTQMARERPGGKQISDSGHDLPDAMDCSAC
jgi:hypothetical protein